MDGCDTYEKMQGKQQKETNYFCSTRTQTETGAGFFVNRPYIKYLIIIDKSDFYEVNEPTDMIVMTVTVKAIQHVSSLMAELGFLAVSSCNFPGNEN